MAAVSLAVCGAAFWLVAGLNRRAARKLEAQIDQLKALEH
jgi:hypothetical protein